MYPLLTVDIRGNICISLKKPLHFPSHHDAIATSFNSVHYITLLQVGGFSFSFLVVLIVHSFSSVAFVWAARGAKTTGQIAKILVFLKSDFFGNEKFQVSAHVLPK
jgi:hypothetical protein